VSGKRSAYDHGAGCRSAPRPGPMGVRTGPAGTVIQVCWPRENSKFAELVDSRVQDLVVQLAGGLRLEVDGRAALLDDLVAGFGMVGGRDAEGGIQGRSVLIRRPASSTPPVRLAMSLTIVLAFSVRVSMATFRLRAVPRHLVLISLSEQGRRSGAWDVAARRQHSGLLRHSRSTFRQRPTGLGPLASTSRPAPSSSGATAASRRHGSDQSQIACAAPGQPGCGAGREQVAT
jgi:hypothetical protein